jgi:hypothetical protein
MFIDRVESANLHLDIDRDEHDIWVCRAGLGIGLHLVKVLLERKHHRFKLLDKRLCEHEDWSPKGEASFASD